MCVCVCTRMLQELQQMWWRWDGTSFLLPTLIWLYFLGKLLVGRLIRLFKFLRQSHKNTSFSSWACCAFEWAIVSSMSSHECNSIFFFWVILLSAEYPLSLAACILQCNECVCMPHRYCLAASCNIQKKLSRLRAADPLCFLLHRRKCSYSRWATGRSSEEVHRSAAEQLNCWIV